MKCNEQINCHEDARIKQINCNNTAQVDYLACARHKVKKHNWNKFFFKVINNLRQWSFSKIIKYVRYYTELGACIFNLYKKTLIHLYIIGNIILYTKNFSWFRIRWKISKKWLHWNSQNLNKTYENRLILLSWEMENQQSIRTFSNTNCFYKTIEY